MIGMVYNGYGFLWFTCYCFIIVYIPFSIFVSLKVCSESYIHTTLVYITYAMYTRKFKYTYTPSSSQITFFASNN